MGAVAEFRICFRKTPAEKTLIKAGEAAFWSASPVLSPVRKTERVLTPAGRLFCPMQGSDQ